MPRPYKAHLFWVKADSFLGFPIELKNYPIVSPDEGTPGVVRS